MAGLHLALHGAVPVVLDGVVGPAWQILGNLGPLVAILGMLLDQDLVLPAGPVSTLDVWVEMVVPPAVCITELSVAVQHDTDFDTASSVGA